MALFIPGPLISFISGSIGGTNFYKHGPWNVIRRKGFGKSSTKFLRGKTLSCWSQAVSTTKAEYTGVMKDRLDRAAERLSFNKHGTIYHLSGFQLMLTQHFLSYFHLGHKALLPPFVQGMFPFVPITVTLEDNPLYIRVVHEAAGILPIILYFDWHYPSSYFCSPKPPKFSYHAKHPFSIAGTWDIPQDTNPRITGKASLWWRARYLDAYGEFTRQVIGKIEKTNWQ